MTAVPGARAVAAAFDLDVVPIPLIVVGTDGVIESANAHAAALLGEMSR